MKLRGCGMLRARVLPRDLKVEDRLADETGEWEVVGRPYASNAGKNAGARVERIGQARAGHAVR